MTHKELLDIISVRSKSFETFNLYPPGFAEALRAVVELHKPVIAGGLDVPSCRECSDFEDAIYVSYPCATNKTIEKELK
jgi:hypothetical protein